MHSGLTPTNITGAALIAQFCILLILGLGSAIIAMGMENRITTTPFIFMLALFSFGVLFFSDEFSKLWTPLFVGTNFTGLKWSTAILLVFLANMFVASILIRFTGGSMVSPFTPIYFMLPRWPYFFESQLSEFTFIWL